MEVKIAKSWWEHNDNVLFRQAHKHTASHSPFYLFAITPGGMLTEPKWHQRGDGEEHKGTGDTDWNQATGLGTGGVDGCLILTSRDTLTCFRDAWLETSKQRKLRGREFIKLSWRVFLGGSRDSQMSSISLFGALHSHLPLLGPVLVIGWVCFWLDYHWI